MDRVRLLWIVCAVLVAHVAGAACAEEARAKLGTHPHAEKQRTEWGRRIHTICPWRGKLYFGYGDYGESTGPITIVSFDPACCKA